MRRVCIFLLLLLLSPYLFGVSAFPGTLSFTQHDGQQFKGKLKGDEWLHWISLPNDYVAIFNPESKNYEYALIKTENSLKHLVSSGIKVDEKLHKLQPKKLSETIPQLDLSTLSTLHREPRVKHHQRPRIKETNSSSYKNKTLKTKSTQWKEILKEENPPK